MVAEASEFMQNVSTLTGCPTYAASLEVLRANNSLAREILAATEKPAAEGDKPDEDDKDPYEGIAPEELPPDLQYDADSSVSFPTNI